MLKNAWRWLKSKAEDTRQVSPQIPAWFEPLESRVLLSVCVEAVQPTNPATPEDYIVSLASTSEDAQKIQPTAEQTSIFIVSDGTQTSARVGLVFPAGSWVIRNWGEVQRQDNVFFVNAEIVQGAEPVDGELTTLVREFDLGALPEGDYVFEFQAWGLPVERRDFRPGPEQWAEYVPTPEQTNIAIIADETGGRQARISIDFTSAGYRVHDWGTVRQEGNTFIINAEVEQWMGASACVITPVSHDYDLGVLPEGDYYIQFKASWQPVASRDLSAGAVLKPVYRFWSPKFSRHFYTQDVAERDKLIRDYPDVWTYEQVAYYAFAEAGEPDTVPVYRFWSGSLGAHFYTLDVAERDKLIKDYSQTWAYEGVSFYAYASGEHPVGTNAVYRFWSRSLVSHFFTASETEMNKLMNLDPRVWDFEGFAWYTYRV